MRDEATCIGRPLVYTVAEDKLIFGADLYIVTRLELAVSHMIFFHPHERSIFVGLTVAIPIP